MSTLEDQVARLGREVEKLNDHRVLRAHDSFFGTLWFNFQRGLAFGLGSVVGATILVSALVYSLSYIDFVPVIGEWAAEIVKVIEGEG